ncbi:MAG: hypothetical protein JSV96_12025 [Candidatus Aminicenantes bacterium]|nr:MAG: hypothetical protein JSV96_12025 [Candidatus Aminicenantes bacterium]
MWKLLKAEIVYNKVLLSIAYFIAVPTLIGSFIWGGWIFNKSQITGPAIVLVHQVVFYAILFPLIFGTKADRRNSKRTRFHAQLIFPIRQLGMIYIALPVLFWFTIVFLFWMICILVFADRIELYFLWQTLALTGFILIAASSALYHDLNYWLKGKFQKLIINILGPVLFIALLFLYFAAILPPLKQLEPLNRSLYNFVFSPLGAIIFLVLGIIVAAFCVVIVAHRKSYSE